MKNEINAADLTEWIKNEARVMYCSRSGEKGSLRLFVRLDGTFEIEQRGVIISKPTSAERAVDMYNSLL